MAVDLDWLQKTAWTDRGYETSDVLRSDFVGNDKGVALGYGDYGRWPKGLFVVLGDQMVCPLYFRQRRYSS
jgi:hypothetical protein